MKYCYAKILSLCMSVFLLYSTELFCAFNAEYNFLKSFDYYYILSFGCGGCTDLMAFEDIINKKCLLQSISYKGIDVNDLWKPIHNKITEYCKANKILFEIIYNDVFNYCNIYKTDDIPIDIINNYHAQSNINRTIQLLIEVA